MAVLAAAVFSLVDFSSLCKSRIEKAASEALGMEVRIGGRVGIILTSDLRVSLGDLRIQNRGADIASAKGAAVAVALAPLLDRKITVTRIALDRPAITVKKGRDGRFNFEPGQKRAGALPAAFPESIVLSGGTLAYEDEGSGEKIELAGFDLAVRGLRASGEGRAESWKDLAFTADFACPKVRVKQLLLSGVKVTCRGQNGRLVFDPLTLNLFGGKGSATVEADLSGPTARVALRASLAGFRIDSCLEALSRKGVVQGVMDFSANLSLSGNTARQVLKTASGEVSLRGENLRLLGKDLDRQVARFESSQNFNLFDASAFFLAGPLGLAATKGLDFATLLDESAGATVIAKFFSDWRVDHGMARAVDVALATHRNRIAFTGRINLVEERFEDVTLALIDEKGCARLKQRIRGPLNKPVVEKPNILFSLAGPALNLLKQAGELILGEKCDAFYRGSVAPPR
jgi:AsmA protein